MKVHFQEEGSGESERGRGKRVGQGDGLETGLSWRLAAPWGIKGSLQWVPLEAKGAFLYLPSVHRSALAAPGAGAWG